MCAMNWSKSSLSITDINVGLLYIVSVASVAKRGLDIAGSTALLVVLAPVLLIVAALVKLTSSGPVFFRQTRVGEQAKPFTMLKFRTMRAGTDRDVDALRACLDASLDVLRHNDEI